MSTAEVEMIPAAVEAAKRLSDLADEYAKKFTEAKASAYSLAQLRNDQKDERMERSLRLRDLDDYLRVLRPPAEQLVRQASQLVEHGAIDGPTRVELRLRLAELEHALASARQVLQGIPR